MTCGVVMIRGYYIEGDTPVHRYLWDKLDWRAAGQQEKGKGNRKRGLPKRRADFNFPLMARVARVPR